MFYDFDHNKYGKGYEDSPFEEIDTILLLNRFKKELVLFEVLANGSFSNDFISALEESFYKIKKNKEEYFFVELKDFRLWTKSRSKKIGKTVA